MKKYFFKIYLILLLLIPIVLFFLPADFFDNGDSFCLSVVFFQTECFGCGMTRAIQHLIHLNFSLAYDLNKISFIVFPLLLFFYLREVNNVLIFLKK